MSWCVFLLLSVKLSGINLRLFARKIDRYSLCRKVPVGEKFWPILVFVKYATLDGFVKCATLDGFVKYATLDGFVKYATLDGFVKYATLDGRNGFF